MRDFKAKNKSDRLVIVWCASTEIFIKPGPQHATIAQFEKAMENNDEMISPSMLYAWAAIMEGVPYCNGAPNLAVDTPALLPDGSAAEVSLSKVLIARGDIRRSPGAGLAIPGDDENAHLRKDGGSE
jgi:myo-inositol-1-phosphate synthase